MTPAPDKRHASRDPIVPVPLVLDVAIDALLSGSSGYLKLPRGATMRCDWMPRAGCYRITLDVVPTGAIAERDLVADVLSANRARIDAYLERSRRTTATQLEQLESDLGRRRGGDS